VQIVVPLVQAALITAGGALAGGAISDRNARSIASKQRQMDMEFAKNQISWKVADAKRAGLHPLYALGASGSYAPTNIVQGQSNTGSALGRASSQIADMYMQSEAQKSQAEATKQLTAAQVNQANQAAARNAAEAGYMAALQKKTEQDILTAGRPRDLWVQWYDNRANKMRWFPNTESGMELSEFIGTSEWYDKNYSGGTWETPQDKARKLGLRLNKKIRGWMKNQYSRPQPGRRGRNRRF
jgi:hypothetical protein